MLWTVGLLRPLCSTCRTCARSKAYLAKSTVPDDATPMPSSGEAERVLFVINAAQAHDKFSLDHMPSMRFEIFEDDGEHFGYLAFQEPDVEPFSPFIPGDVLLTLDGEEWRPESFKDIGWLLGRFTWATIWDKPATATILRDGQLIKLEVVWSYEDATES